MKKQQPTTTEPPVINTGDRVTCTQRTFAGQVGTVIGYGKHGDKRVVRWDDEQDATYTIDVKALVKVQE